MIYLRLIGSVCDFTSDTKKLSAPQPQSSESQHGECIDQADDNNRQSHRQDKNNINWICSGAHIHTAYLSRLLAIHSLVYTIASIMTPPPP